MPSRAELPTVEALRRAFLAEATASAAVRGDKADTHPGSLYDHCAGAGAILMRRVSARDRDEFRALYFTQADDRGLDLLATAVGRPRQEAERGRGSLTVTRASGPAGWFRRGTRVAAGGSFAGPELFVVDEDVWASPSDVLLELPVRAGRDGSAAIKMAAGDPGALRWEDPIFDPGWTIAALECSAGTQREDAAALRTALRTTRRDGRVGYARALADACRTAGASFVALFASDYLGPAADYGLNRIYIADSADTTTPALLRACRAAVAGIGMAGANLQVLPSVRVALSVELVVTLYDALQSTRHLRADVVAGVVDYFRDVVLWRTSGIAGAVFRAIPGLASGVSVVAPTGEPAQALPAVLNRYDVPSHAVRVTFAGPA